MATRARNRIVVKSKSKSSMVTSTSSSSEFSSEGPFIAPLTSTPAKPLINSTADANPNSGTRPRSHARFKSKGNKVKPAPIIHPPPRPHSVSGSVMASHRKHRESSSSEGDNVFTMQGDLHLAKTTPITNNRPQNFRPMYLSSSQLLPSLYYKPVDNQFPRNSGNRHNQILPVLNLQPNSMSVSSQFYHSYLSSPSPTTDANSTFSSLSSPLPPLLVQSMRKGGTKPSALSNWQSDSVLENILPGGVLKVFIGTWNMYEQKVLPMCIDDFLLPTTHETAGDLFVIGTQESAPNKQEWEILLQQTLGPTHILIQSVTLGVLYLDVFLRRDLIWYCSDVQSSSYATRPINIIKTKGCVAVHLTLFGSSFLFLSSHLSAGNNNCTERNSDVHRTLNNLQFNIGSNKKSLIESHDFIFWCGDFNYRLELDKNTAESSIKRSDWMSLLVKDQLTREMLADNVFHGFSEQPIAFPPSYKFDINSNNYDTSEKARTPSWTDRVLFRSGKGGLVVGCGYNSCDSIKSSDHRPVYALFNTELKPLEEIDGVPSNPAGYNRDLYTKAMRRRKQVARKSIDLLHQEPDNGSTPLPQFNSRHTSSTVCIIL